MKKIIAILFLITSFTIFADKYNLKAVIETNKGNINLELYGEKTPVTVANFVALSENKFYNNLKFHRVIENFMIQGGCPLGTGTGGPNYQFGDEFKKDLVFDKPGLLAMANSGPNTNGSQFFITHVKTSWLNYRHTIFGNVISDKDQTIVNKIKQGDIIKTIKINGNLKEFKKDNIKTFDQLNKLIKD